MTLDLVWPLPSDWSTNQGVIIMWSDTATGHGFHKQRDEQKNEGMDAKKNGKERLQPRLQAELRTLSAAGSVEPCS